MLRIFRNKVAQTTAEYAILIAIVVGAVVAMQVYIKRGLQGRIRDVVDTTGVNGQDAGGDTALTLTGKQYEPYYINNDIASGRQSNVNENTSGGGTGTKTLQNDTVTQSGTRTTDLGRAEND